MEYLAEHNKSYATHYEYAFRMAQFYDTDSFIRKINAPDSGYTHTAGHNKFSDWTSEEFSSMFTETDPSMSFAIRQAPKIDSSSADGKHIDWRETCVGEVKEMNKAAESWAFAAIGGMESSHCISDKVLFTLSE